VFQVFQTGVDHFFDAVKLGTPHFLHFVEAAVYIG